VLLVLAIREGFGLMKTMKTFSLLELSRYGFIGLMMAFGGGCASMHQKPQPPVAHCPAKYSFHYVDSAHGYSLCLPAQAKKGDASGYPTGSVLFNGLPVPAGTNLESKQLIIVSGMDDNMQGSTAFGHLTVDGVTFQRVKASDGSAGHSTLHVIYTWTHNGKTLHFDFAHRAVNVLVFDPPNRPAEYDQAAQVKISEEIMHTFRRLP
jgi:hypothetical protein